MTGPRVRFAPSPTGFFHVGSARIGPLQLALRAPDATACFILRIEDTDADRNREEWARRHHHRDGLAGTRLRRGSVPSERQLTRPRRRAPRRCYASGYLYYCDCTREEIDERTRATNKTRATTATVAIARSRARDAPRLRFRDARRGGHRRARPDPRRRRVRQREHRGLSWWPSPRAPCSTPLANVIDDRNDRITHVIRGEEHLPTPPSR